MTPVTLPPDRFTALKATLLDRLEMTLRQTMAEAGLPITPVNREALKAHGIDADELLTVVLGLGCNVWPQPEAWPQSQAA